MNLICVLPGAVVALALLLPSPASHADDWANAVEVCQGSLPNFEGQLRKRPLAIANEGVAPSFISCSLRKAYGDGTLPSGVIVLMTNRAAVTQDAACTLVDGLAAPWTQAVYQPKSASIAPGTYAILQWAAATDNGNNAYTLPNLNCALPPGMEINVVQLGMDAFS